MRTVALVLALAASLPVVATAAEVGDPARGLAYVEKNCATCHAVGPRNDLSPERKATSLRQVANTPGMTSTALTVWFRTPHPNMPNLMLPDADRLDVIAYILSLKD